MLRAHNQRHHSIGRLEERHPFFPDRSVCNVDFSQPKESSILFKVISRKIVDQKQRDHRSQPLSGQFGWSTWVFSSAELESICRQERDISARWRDVWRKRDGAHVLERFAGVFQSLTTASSIVYIEAPHPFLRSQNAQPQKSQVGCLWMRGVREGWFKECKIDTAKVKLCLVPVVTVACGRS